MANMNTPVYRNQREAGARPTGEPMVLGRRGTLRLCPPPVRKRETSGPTVLASLRPGRRSVATRPRAEIARDQGRGLQTLAVDLITLAEDAL